MGGGKDRHRFRRGKAVSMVGKRADVVSDSKM